MNPLGMILVGKYLFVLSLSAMNLLAMSLLPRSLHVKSLRDCWLWGRHVQRMN